MELTEVAELFRGGASVIAPVTALEVLWYLGHIGILTSVIYADIIAYGGPGLLPHVDVEVADPDLVVAPMISGRSETPHYADACVFFDIGHGESVSPMVTLN